jgi:hypothetical protein
VTRILSAVLVAISLFVSPGCSSLSAASSSGRVVVMIDKGPSGFIFRVNSKVTRHMLLTLSEMRAQDSDPHAKSILIVHEDVTLTMINGMRGVMSKAGYVLADQRVLFFNRDNVKDVMTEIKFSTPLPFSAAGDVSITE